MNGPANAASRHAPVERTEVVLADMIAGFVSALRLDGFTSFPVGRRTEEALVEAGRAFMSKMDADGLDCLFVLFTHYIHGGCSDIKYALGAAQSPDFAFVDVYDGVMRLQMSTDWATSMLENLPGDAEHYRALARDYERAIRGDRP